MPVSKRALAAAMCVGALAVSGCASGGKAPVAIGIDPNSPEQVVLGEIYRQVLMNQGRPTSVTAVPFSGSALEVLKSSQIQFAVTCTGQLLHDESPSTAEALSKRGPSEEAGEFSDEVYRDAVAIFPSDLRTVDPSPAQGCGAGFGAEDAGGKSGKDEMPQNIIPVFQKGMFDRGEINRLNFATRAMATDDIVELAEDLESGTPLNQVVRDWLLEYVQINPVGDEPVDEDKAPDPNSAKG